jgi:hypothetical protein
MTLQAFRHMYIYKEQSSSKLAKVPEDSFQRQALTPAMQNLPVTPQHY